MRIEPNHPNAKVVKMLVDRLVLLCTVMVAGRVFLRTRGLPPVPLFSAPLLEGRFGPVP